MKELYLIRHAKSSWADAQLKDIERPLNARGKHDAALMGRVLKERNERADIILCSPAKRSRKTAKKVAKQIAYDPKKIVVEPKIYESSAQTLLKLIRAQNDIYNTLFLVGHNPELNMFAYELVGFEQNIPTTGIVKIRFGCDTWKESSAKNASLEYFDYPKRYYR